MLVPQDFVRSDIIFICQTWNCRTVIFVHFEAEAYAVAASMIRRVEK